MASLPPDFLALMRSYGSPVLEGIGEALCTEPEVSVRLNSSKCQGVDLNLEPVPWCENGYYLPERVKFTFDPQFHQGCYYVQDASSMFVGHVLRSLIKDGEPVSILDACAAPGGKTTAAIDAVPYGSEIVANEYVAARAAVLRENLAKWGYPYCRVTQGDTAQFAKPQQLFNVILADVPCSGEGMMRKDTEAVEQWTPALVEQCAERQREIVDNLWPSLAPGGLFIYSTCTFNRTENEEMVAYIINKYGAESVAIPVDEKWGISPGIDTPYHCYRFVPGKTRGEGLFMAVIRKMTDCQASLPKNDKKRSKGKQKAPAVPENVKRWIDMPGAEFMIDGDSVIATFGNHGSVLEIGKVKGRDVVPSQQLALSSALRREAFEVVEVSGQQAIDYLSCMAITLPDGTPHGIVLLTYGGRPLGFAKNLGSRANNLYPKPWRILTQNAQFQNGLIKQ